MSVNATECFGLRVLTPCSDQYPKTVNKHEVALPTLIPSKEGFNCVNIINPVTLVDSLEGPRDAGGRGESVIMERIF